MVYLSGTSQPFAGALTRNPQAPGLPPLAQPRRHPNVLAAGAASAPASAASASNAGDGPDPGPHETRRRSPLGHQRGRRAVPPLPNAGL
jgi:hypothetical protein